LEDNRTIKIVNRDIKKTLDLTRVQIDRYHTVNSRFFKHIRNKTGSNGDARSRFSVLTRISEIRDNRSNRARRRTAKSVGHDEQFHQIVIGWGTGALDNKDIPTTNALADLDINLTVAKTFNFSF
jgi:hypothetical protein